MTTPPPRRPQSNLGGPHASRSERVRNAKGQGANISGTNLGDAPRSSRMKFFLWVIVAIFIVFVISDIIENATSEKKKGFHIPPTQHTQIGRYV